MSFVHLNEVRWLFYFGVVNDIAATKTVNMKIQAEEMPYIY